MTGFDPQRLLETLTRHGVDFIVIGMTAAWLQGAPAVTVDLDVMPRRDLENAERLAAALNELRARRAVGDEVVELEGADFLGWDSHDFVTDAGPVDVVPTAAAIGGFEQVAHVAVRIGDLDVRLATLDEIIASKQALDRPKDRAALPALHAAKAAAEERRST